MTPQEIMEVLRANTGKRLRVTFEDGMVESVTIDSVDDKGFVHSGPDGENSQGFWTRFEFVKLLEQDTSN